MANRGRHKKKQRKYKNTWLTNVLTDVELDLIFKRALEQGNHPTLNLIEHHPQSSSIMVWSYTPDGWNFWNNLFERVKEYKRIHSL